MSKIFDQVILSAEKDLKTNLKSFFDHLMPNDLVLLEGPVGAGKTTLVKSYVDYKSQNQKEIVASSPSYNLIHEYQLNDFNVIHIDLYRIENEEDLESTGFWDLMQSKNTVFFIEWPERIQSSDLNFLRTIEVNIEISDLDTRTFNIKI